MVQEKMSLRSRRELLDCIREKYNQAPWKEKIKILDLTFRTMRDQK